MLIHILCFIGGLVAGFVLTAIMTANSRWEDEYVKKEN